MMLSRREFLKKGTVIGAGVALGGAVGSCSWVRAGKNKTPPLKEAWFYQKSKDGKVKCGLCPWGCRLPEGDTGRCRVRKNMGGKLFTLVYGKPVAIHTDPVEKKPFYHFLPGREAFSLATVGCNLHCLFCQNWEISQATPESIPYYNALPQTLVSRAKRAKTPIIAYTYTEPVIFYEYMFRTAEIARSKGLRNVMISAGFVNSEPLKNLCKVLDGIKIDLKSFNSDFYKKLVNGRLDPVLNTLTTIRKAGVWLEIVNLIIPGKNDDQSEITEMALWIKKNLGDEVPIHFTRFIPMYKMVNVPATPVKTLERCRNTALKCGLKFVYVGNVPGHPGNNTYCPGCGKVIIKRFGYRVDASKVKNGKCCACGRKIPGVWG